MKRSDNLTLEYWPVQQLRPCTTELKKNDALVGRMAEAIRTYGFRLPVLARASGEVVDAHLRLKAALALGLAEVPVVTVDGLSEPELRAFRLMINRSSLWAEWLDGAVAVELAELRELEVDRLLHSLALDSEEKDPNVMPDLPDAPASVEGDLWLLGSHRLAVGDSTSIDTYLSLMKSGETGLLGAYKAEEAEMIWTDPPYNVAYQGKAGSIKNDSMSDAAFARFIGSAFRLMGGVLRPGGAAYVAHADAGTCGLIFRWAFLKAGFKLSSCLVWRKNQSVLSRADYHWQHEPVLYGWKKSGSHRWQGDRKQTTVLEAFPTAVEVEGEDGRSAWHVAEGSRLLRITGDNVLVEELPSSLLHAKKPQSSKLHPTMKPVELIEPMLMNSSGRGDIVLDPFGGSGSTLVACERTGRRCRTIELDPRFADAIIMRWQEYTGGEAFLASTGESFAQVQEARHDR